MYSVLHTDKLLLFPLPWQRLVLTAQVHHHTHQCCLLTTLPLTLYLTRTSPTSLFIALLRIDACTFRVIALLRARREAHFFV